MSDQHLIGTEGNDQLQGADGNDHLEGLGGSDTLQGGWGNDLLDGGAGTDSLHGGFGADTYLFGRDSGNDTIWADNTPLEEDRLQFGATITLADIDVWASVSSLYLDIAGTRYSVSVIGDGTSSPRLGEMAFADGSSWDATAIDRKLVASDDFLQGGADVDTLDGGLGNDYLMGGGGDDFLYGDAGNDWMSGGAGADTYFFGRGDASDTISDAAPLAEDRLVLASRITLADVAAERLGDDLSLTIHGTTDRVLVLGYFLPGNALPIQFADGASWDAASIDRKVIASDDFVQGGAGAETLDGGLGNDSLMGGAGNDFLYGDAGADLMSGGAGADTYFFGYGDGHDSISGWDAPLSEDTLVFGAGITLVDVAAVQTGSDLVLSLDGGERISVFGHFADPANRLSEIRFADGASWDAAAIVRKVVATDDYLLGTAVSDTLDGGLGNDWLEGGEGNDFLYGGGGVDTLRGGLGSDTYFFGRGDGYVTIDHYESMLESETLQFGAGVSLADVLVAPDPYNLRLRLEGSADTVSVTGPYGSVNLLGRIRFADGASWDGATLSRKMIASDDLLQGGAGTDTLDGGLGNDSLIGGAGDDFLYGDAGNDMMWGGDGADTYYFGRGDRDDAISGSALAEDRLALGSGITMADVVAGRSGDDLSLAIHGSYDRITVFGYFAPGNAVAIEFADGTSWDAAAIARKVVATDDHLPGTAGSDTLDGGLGNDSLSGGAGDDFLYGDSGNDLLWGGAGADTYIFGLGDGQDAITGGGDPLAEDRLAFGSGITLVDVAVTRQSDDLTLALDGSGDGISALGYFADPANRLSEIRFADGSSWDEAAIQRKVVASDDTLFGTSGSDTLDGGLGNDNIFAGDGDDFIYGGGGIDMLRGGLGFDTYFFGRGDGYVTIDHYESMLENETLRFGAGITLADVQVAPNTSNLVLTLEGSSDTVYVMGPYPSIYLLGQIRFADGSSWDGQTLARKMSASDDYLPGTAASDTLDGGLGNDNIFAGEGDDFLHGDAGSDTLGGGGGNDVFFFDGSSQSDLILDAATSFDAGFDTIRLGGDLANARVEFGSDPLETTLLRLSWPDQGAELRLSGFLQPWAVDRIDALTIGQGSENHLMHGTSADDVLSGSALLDIFLDSEGADWLAGGAGHDLYIRGATAGVDTVFDVADAAGGNHVMFGAMSAAEIQLGYEGQFLVLSSPFEGDLVKLSGFDSQDVFGGARAVQNFGFSDGTALSYEQLLERGFDLFGTDELAGEMIEGTNVHDRIHGLGGGDALAGNGGDDELYGGAGSDTLHGDGQDDVGDDYLDGGAGNDSLFGGRGSDTYYFDRLSGTDTVLELHADAGDIDTLLFGAGITPDDLLVAQDELGNLHIAISGSTAALRFNAWFNPEIPSHVERFEFQDGTILSDAVIEAMINDAPVVANPLVDLSAAEDAAFSFNVPANTFADPDPYDSLIYAASLADGSALPSWLAFDAGTRTFSGTPANGDVGTISLRLAATDETGSSASDVFALTVTNTNDAPTLAASIADQNATEDTAFTFAVAAGTFADVDLGDALAFSAVQADGGALPPWLTFDAASRTFSGTPANADVGTISVRVTATDEAGASASDVFDIAVVNTNDAPIVATPIADQNATEDSAFSFTFATDAFADVDIGDFLDYSATLASGSALPSWLLFDPGTRTFTGTPANGDVGTIAVRVTATDAAGASASDVFDIAVANTNDAPVVASPIADQSAQDTIAFSFTVPAGTFADLDAGDPLSYSATLAGGGALPAWLAFNPATRTFSGTPGVADMGTLSIVVTVTDGAGVQASDVFAITVGAAPDQMITGTAGNDTLVGASGNDTIDGLGGADSMSGGLGNDLYYVGQSGDAVIENTAAGVDTVRASISYTLAANVENLELIGTAAINGTGNALDNILSGNAANNRLSGGAGNDSYIITQSGDTVVENSGAGVDAVHASISYTLGNHVENLMLTGNGNISGTGNSLANWLTGNSGSNILKGGGGADSLSGGAGNDTLTGGSGSDAFYFLEAPGAGNADHITDFAAGERLYLEDLVHSDIGAAGLFAPNDARFFAAAGASSGADATDRVVYDTATGRLYFDADGSGAAAPTLIAILDNVFALSATDIAVS